MQIVSRKRLVAFWEKHPQAETPLRNWFSIAQRATWTTPQEIKNAFGSVDFVGDNRLIFNVGGNKYRLVVHVSYTYKAILIKFVGTQEEYDDIDPETV